MAELKTYEKSGGRDVIVTLFEVVDTLEAGDSLEVGKYYGINSIDDTASVFAEGLKEGMTFYAYTTATLADGDIAVELSDPWDKSRLVGFANSKELSFSKDTYDATTDGDDYVDTHSEDIVNISGSFSGFKTLGATANNYAALIEMRNKFISSAEFKSTGVSVSDRDNKGVLLGFIFHRNEPAAGENVEMTILPAMITSNAESSSYNSATTQNIAFTGTSRSLEGMIPFNMNVTYPA